MVSFDGRGPGTPASTWSAEPRLATLGPITVPLGGRVVVVAAHPDDETLGAGGLLAELAAVGRPAEVIVVTDGAASHPGSSTLGVADLRRRRVEEIRRALDLLSPSSPVTLLGHEDGAVLEHRADVTRDLRQLLETERPPDVLVVPWRGDGHRDHRVVGEICAALALELGAQLVEYPIWMWHWGSPDEPAIPWDQLRSLALSDRSVVLKRRAVATHVTQVRAASAAPADAAPLHPDFLEAFDRDVEVFVVADERPSSDVPASFFDASYERRPDPWYLASRWYEQRKRSATLAALPEQHLGAVLEIGCSIGVLTAELAPRCDLLVATDVSAAALAQAKERTADLTNVELMQHDIADGVPGGPFDLIVLSEVGYYLSGPHLRELATTLTHSLTATGGLVACHWRHPVAEYPLGGDDVHRILRGALGMTRLVHHLEDDFVLEVWSRDGRSVARRSGLA